MENESMTYRQRFTMQQLLERRTWGSTLEEHLIEDTRSLLEKQDVLQEYQYHETSIGIGDGYIDVIIKI